MSSRNRKTIIAILAVALVLLTSIGVTVAYFSDYETAMGELTLHLSGETEITEEVTDTQKDVRIANTGEFGDASVVVRVMILGPDGMTVTIKDNHWHKNGDYYYYDKVLAPGEETGSIIADIKNIPVTADMEAFDIIVNHESAIAAYDENNIVKKPDAWDYIPTIKAQEGGN